LSGAAWNSIMIVAQRCNCDKEKAMTLLSVLLRLQLSIEDELTF